MTMSWVIDSLDNVIQHFSAHAQRILKFIYVALDQRIREVAEIEGAIANIEISESTFEGKLSVAKGGASVFRKIPKYDVFRDLIFGQQKGQCKGTGFEIFFSESSVDHVLPKSKGGSDELGNLIVMCSACNNLKGDKSLGEYLEDIELDPSVCAGYNRTSDDTNQ